MGGKENGVLWPSVLRSRIAISPVSGGTSTGAGVWEEGGKHGLEEAQASAIILNFLSCPCILINWTALLLMVFCPCLVCQCWFGFNGMYRTYLPFLPSHCYHLLAWKE